MRHVIAAWVGGGRASARRATRTRDFTDWRSTGAHESEGDKRRERANNPRAGGEARTPEPRSTAFQTLYRAEKHEDLKRTADKTTRASVNDSRRGVWEDGEGLVESQDQRTHLSSHAHAGEGRTRSNPMSPHAPRASSPRVTFACVLELVIPPVHRPTRARPSSRDRVTGPASACVTCQSVEKVGLTTRSTRGARLNKRCAAHTRVTLSGVGYAHTILPNCLLR